LQYTGLSDVYNDLNRQV